MRGIVAGLRARPCCIACRDPEVYPAAAGSERIVELGRGDRRLFAGVADPDSPSIDLEWSLLRVVGTRMAAGDNEAKSIGRNEALKPDGNPEPLIAALTSTDANWVVAHASDIVAKHPKTGWIILFNLEQVGVAVGDVGEQIAAAAAEGDRSFESNVKRYLDDPQAKARILAGARKRASRNRDGK